MELQDWLDLFKARGFSVAPTCRERLEEEIVHRVNDAVVRSKGRGEKDAKLKRIEIKGKVYMRSVAREMMAAARSRGSTVLGEEDFDEARGALGPLPVLE